jgi:photosystem II stability/assembly factor-like uncharacterized protein
MNGDRMILARVFSVALCLFVAGCAAPPRPSSKPPSENFFTIKARRDAAFAARAGQVDLREEGTGFGAYRQWVQQWEPKLTPHGDFAVVVAAERRLAERLSRTLVRRAGTRACPPRIWTELGPFDRPTGTSPSRGTGKISWITMDPSNPNHLFAGSSKGGLFHSLDGGAIWQKGGTDFFLPHIGAAHLAVHPQDSNTWLLATGDGDGLEDNAWNTATGVYRTRDAGAHWEKIGLDFSQDDWTYQIKKLMIDPVNPAVVWAATSLGLFRTDNALAAVVEDVQWVKQVDGRFYDIERRPNSATILYASGPQIVWSQDNGVSWQPLPGAGFVTPDVVRVAMEVTPANDDYIYMVVVYKDPDPLSNSIYSTSRLFRYDVATHTARDKGPIYNTGSYSGDVRGVQVSRAQSIGVSPIDANLVYLGDVSPVVKCTTGGDSSACAWIKTANQMHDDIHQVMFSPDGHTIYVAGDGGVFQSADGGASWVSSSAGLAVATIERMATSVTDPHLILQGNFDTGTNLYDGTGFRHVSDWGGDGLTPIIDYTDPTYMWASTENSYMRRSEDGGLTFPYFASAGTGPVNWFTFAVLDSGNPQTMYLAGVPEVYRSTDRGNTWKAISQFAAIGLGAHVVWKIYTAPSDPNYLYVHLVATGSQLLYYTTEAHAPTPTWQSLGHPALHWISGIEVHEADPTKFWLTYDGYSPDKVFKYENGVFTNITGNLAAINPDVMGIVRERGSNDRLFVGTRVGVFEGDGANPQWQWYGVGLPHVESRHLEINYVVNKLRVGTYGRGLWETDLDPCVPIVIVGPNIVNAVIKDSSKDLGNEPNTDSGSDLSSSPDIWVRNTPDHRFTSPPVPPRYSREHRHENPEYSPIAFNTPWLYAKVRNWGNQPVSGRVRFYWGDASTALDWPNNWTEIVPANVASVTVSGLLPQGTWVVSLQWTDIPKPPPQGGPYSLLARFESTADPITGENPGPIQANVAKSNNIAWKNVTVVDLLQN